MIDLFLDITYAVIAFDLAAIGLYFMCQIEKGKM